jgi:hypothetical protein
MEPCLEYGGTGKFFDATAFRILLFSSYRTITQSETCGSRYEWPPAMQLVGIHHNTMLSELMHKQWLMCWGIFLQEHQVFSCLYFMKLQVNCLLQMRKHFLLTVEPLRINLLCCMLCRWEKVSDVLSFRGSVHHETVNIFSTGRHDASSCL